MRIREIMESMGGTVSGGVATVAAPIGGVISRSGGSLLGGKYTSETTPNTPEWMKKYKGKKRVK